MKKYFSLLFLLTAFFAAGCGNKKRTKASVEQQETVIKHFVQEEQAADIIKNDKKEDYVIA
jgi:hypothetical protein